MLEGMKGLIFATIALLSVANAEDFDKLFKGELEVISEGHQFAEGMAFDADGNFYFTDVPAGKLFKIDKVGPCNIHNIICCLNSKPVDNCGHRVTLDISNSSSGGSKKTVGTT